MHDTLLKQRGSLGCWGSAGVYQCGLWDSQHRSSWAMPPPQAQLTLEEQGADAGGGPRRLSLSAPLLLRRAQVHRHSQGKAVGAAGEADPASSLLFFLVEFQLNKGLPGGGCLFRTAPTLTAFRDLFKKIRVSGWHRPSSLAVF